jgi:hypothetical protein
MVPSTSASPTDSPPSSDSPPDANDGRVEWDATDERDLAELAKHGLAGLYLLFLSLVVVGMVFVALASIGGGGEGGGEISERAWLFVVLLFIGGPASLLYLATAVGAGGTESLVKLVPGVETLSIRGVAAGALVAAVALLSALVHPVLPLVYAGSLMLLHVVGSAQQSKGTVDPETTTLTREVGERHLHHDVSSLTGLRSLRFGSYVVCWLQYDDLALDTPRFLVFPASEFPSIRTALDEIRQRERDDETPSAPGVRGVSTVFGLLFVGLAAAIVLFVPNPLVSFYATMTVGLLGVFFLFLAWKS